MELSNPKIQLSLNKKRTPRRITLTKLRNWWESLWMCLTNALWKLLFLTSLGNVQEMHRVHCLIS